MKHAKFESHYYRFKVYLADPLGVAGVLVTSDGQVIFHRRNHWVAEAAGKLDVPGGHPEPTVSYSSQHSRPCLLAITLRFTNFFA